MVVDVPLSGASADHVMAAGQGPEEERKGGREAAQGRGRGGSARRGGCPGGGRDGGRCGGSR